MSAPTCPECGALHDMTDCTRTAAMCDCCDAIRNADAGEYTRMPKWAAEVAVEAVTEALEAQFSVILCSPESDHHEYANGLLVLDAAFHEFHGRHRLSHDDIAYLQSITDDNEGEL